MDRVSTEDYKVSVIIPFYNRIPLVMESVASVQAQTHRNWELLLVNDGSTEEFDALRELISKDDRIILLEQENNGVSASRNLGIRTASGDYIAFLDSDDLWLPGKLQTQLQYMLENGFHASHTSFAYMPTKTGKAQPEEHCGAIEGMLLPELISECRLSVSTFMVNSTLVKGIKEPFCPRYHYGEDACFFISLAEQIPFGGVDQCLTLFRLRDTTAALDSEHIRMALTNILEFILHSDSLSAYQDQISSLYRKISECTSYIDLKNELIKPLHKKIAQLQPMRDVVENKFRSLGFFPKVSIIIPVYNGANYMRDAINSALLQTYPNIEVIVVNDGSTDGGDTTQIANYYGSLIQYIEKPNGGVATALNLGIEKMTGEYFSWLSHDDMYTPEKVEHELSALIHQSDRTVLVAEGYQVVNCTGEYLYTVNLYDQYPTSRINNSMFCLLRGGINGCALLIHKSHFQRVGVFDPDLPTTQDYDLWFRMLRGQKIQYLPSSNVLSRSHEEQGSKMLLSSHIEECDALWIKMMATLTVEEKESVSGSVTGFYQEIYDFLHQVTGYSGAIAYAKRQMVVAALSEYEQTKKEKYLTLVAKNCGETTTYIKSHILPYRKRKTNKARLFFQLGERNLGGGLNKIVVQTASQLSDTYDVVIGSWGAPFRNGYASNPAVTELCLDYPADSLSNYVTLLALLDVDVYIYSYCCSPEWLPLLSELKSSGIKTIAWSHEDYFLPYWRESLWRSLPARNAHLPAANAVLWLSSSSLSSYNQKYGNGVCIPNSVSLEAPANPLSYRGKRLIAFGRFDDARKGLDDLLRIFSSVHKRHQDSELYIVGSYDLDLPVRGAGGMTCREFLKKEKVPGDNLHFVGWTENVDNYYQLGALHIMPSSYEGFGLVVLEAAAYGVPTIAYDGSGMAEIIRDGVDGVLTSRLDWKKMAAQVSDLLDEPTKIQKLREALPEMLARYEPTQITKMWMELIETLVSQDSQRIEAYFEKQHAEHLQNDVTQATIAQYELTISNMSEKLEQAPSAGGNSSALLDDIWAKECLLMQQSLSWRITKPIRLVKKVMVVWKNEGFMALLRKTRKKLQGK